MSDLTLETLNRRVAIAAARQEATRIGADPEALLDRASFYNQLSGLDPDAPGFTAQIRQMVGAAAGHAPAASQARQPSTAAPARSGGEHSGTAGGNRQWTLEDVKAASPSETLAAIDAGLLTGLGVGPRKRR